MHIFEKASRQKLRFVSVRGDITTEQLWDLPLTSRNGFDLDSVAKAVNQELKQVAEESFVATSANPAKATLELKLEIVKHVIAARIEAADTAKKRAENKAERERLMELLHAKKDQELMGKTPEEIQAMIDKLDS